MPTSATPTTHTLQCDDLTCELTLQRFHVLGNPVTRCNFSIHSQPAHNSTLLATGIIGITSIATNPSPLPYFSDNNAHVTGDISLNFCYLPLHQLDTLMELIANIRTKAIAYYLETYPPKDGNIAP